MKKKCFLLIVFALVCITTVNADPIVYRGTYGEYYPQESDVVVPLNDGNLQVTRSNGTTVLINLSTIPLIRQVMTSGNRVKDHRNHPVAEGSLLYLDPKEIVALRRQDVEELEALSEVNIDQRRQSGRELNDQHDRRKDWSKEGRSWSKDARNWKRDQDRKLERQARDQARQKKDQIRAREKAVRELKDSTEKVRKESYKRRQDLRRQLERAQIREQIFGKK